LFCRSHPTNPRNPSAAPPRERAPGFPSGPGSLMAAAQSRHRPASHAVGFARRVPRPAQARESGSDWPALCRPWGGHATRVQGTSPQPPGRRAPGLDDSGLWPMKTDPGHHPGSQRSSACCGRRGPTRPHRINPTVEQAAQMIIGHRVRVTTQGSQDSTNRKKIDHGGVDKQTWHSSACPQWVADLIGPPIQPSRTFAQHNKVTTAHTHHTTTPSHRPHTETIPRGLDGQSAGMTRVCAPQPPSLSVSLWVRCAGCLMRLGHALCGTASSRAKNDPAVPQAATARKQTGDGRPPTPHRTPPR